MANLSGISNESLMGKLLRAPLRLIPRAAAVPILQGPLRGRRWIVGSSTHGCWIGSYEQTKQKALQRELKAGDVVYDIGANVGFYSLLASVLVGETGRVYSFEPSPVNVEILRKHLRINRVANCTVIDAAVGSVDGVSAFEASEDRHKGHLVETGGLQVRVLTLDRLISETGMRPPSLMKIDIEGAELDCLRGASHVIQKFRPVIFLATHGPGVHQSCLDALRGWNYRLSSLDARPLEATDELVAVPEMSS
jgi:FkbM family methyltransferase